MSEDLFTAPVSDYQKTVWYNQYDVSHLLAEGENDISIIKVGGKSYFEIYRKVLDELVLILKDEKMIFVKFGSNLKNHIHFGVIRNG